MNDTPSRDLDPRVKFVADHFGFTSTWEEGPDGFCWYVRTYVNRTDFFWREDEGVAAFLDTLHDFFIEGAERY